MRNIKLTIAYDGTDYHGWQIQPGLPTVQGTLLDVLRQLTPRDPQELAMLHGAGRTDAGVHAWGQVANFNTDATLPPDEFTRAFNALLPPAIRVRQAEEAEPHFHARHNAQAKTYRYRIYRGAVLSPFAQRHVLHHPHALNLDAMSEAARLFEGDHNFATFAASTGNEEEDNERTTQRTIFSSQVRCERTSRENDAIDKTNPDGEEWVYEVRGRSFMRNMVRKMAGTLMEVGRGRLNPEDIPRLLQLSDPAASGPTVPPQGLCLHSVEYPSVRQG